MAKYCIKCGTKLPDEALYCYKCGAKYEIVLAEKNISNTESKSLDDKQNSRKDVKEKTKALWWPMLILWFFYLYWAIYHHGIQYGLSIERAVLFNNKAYKVYVSIIASALVFSELRGRKWIAYSLGFVSFLLSEILGLGGIIIFLMIVYIVIDNAIHS